MNPPLAHTLYAHSELWQKGSMISARVWGSLHGSRRLRAVAAVLGLSGGLIISPVAPGRADEVDFATWLQEFRQEAQASGISSHTVELALANVAPIQRVIELDRKQPEFTLTFAEYIARVVSQGRVDRGRELLDENRALLNRVSATYGVQPRFIVALWGIESDFGRTGGDFPVISALATLAYDGRRRSYFKNELLDALQILERGYINLPSLRGSWAGAMGQNQFMPSSYLRYAVDYEGKGQRDIWHNKADVFASTANYLAHEGWKSEETWGREVRLPPGFDMSLAGLSIRKTLPEWNAVGVRRANDKLLPETPLEGSIVLPDGEGGPAYVVYDNYRAIMKWNRSTFFATAVGILADRIKDR